MNSAALSHPAGVLDRLEAIEQELATAENDFENAAMAWFQVRRLRAHQEATAFVSAQGTDTARRLAAKAVGADVGWEDEARYEILKTKIRTLGDRATIGQSILKAQGR